MKNGTRVVNARDDLFYTHNCCCHLFLLKHLPNAGSSSNSIQFNLFHFPVIHYKVVNHMDIKIVKKNICIYKVPQITVNPYPTAFPYGNGMVLHFYQQQESSTTKTVHRVINKGLKAYV